MLSIIINNKLFEVEKFWSINMERIAYRVWWWYARLYKREYIEATEYNLKIMEWIKIKQNEILELEKLYIYTK